MTQASFRQNEDVRKISAWAAIIAVPTLISGIYGMNFEHMPELELAGRLPARAPGHGRALPRALRAVQTVRLALTKPIRSYIASSVGAEVSRAFSAPSASSRCSSASSDRSAR